MQIVRLLESLSLRQPRIPVLPVQMDVIQPLLKRVAAAERARARPRPKPRALAQLKPHPLHQFKTLGLAAVSLPEGRGHGLAGRDAPQASRR